MSTLPPLPPELGRFHDIVDAHKRGDSLELSELVDSVIESLKFMIRNSDEYTKKLQSILIQVDTYKLRELQKFIDKPKESE